MPTWAFRRVVFIIALSQSLAAQTTSAVSHFSSPNPSTYGTAVTITATVTPSAATGIVTFYDGASVLGISPISGGQALFATRLLTTGARSLRADYSGDSTYAPADSATAYSQMVNSVAGASFAPAVTYSVLSPLPLVSGDFNRDGKTDLVVGSFGGSALDVFLGNGDGTFQQVATYTIPSLSSIRGGRYERRRHSRSGYLFWDRD
jgi:hypothetical protein